MKNKIILLQIIFFFLVTHLLGQEKINYFFLSESMLPQKSIFPERGYLSIEQNWKYHPGNPVNADTTWTKPDFNDSSWENISTTLRYDSLPQGGWKGIGWFRLYIEIDSALLNKPLAFHVTHFGASDVYVDGKLFCQNGKAGTSGKDEQGYNTTILPPQFIIFTRRQHLIAIRYSGFNILNNRPPTIDNLGFTPGIGNPDIISMADQKNATFFRSHEALVIAVPLTFTLIHFILFLFYRREKSNLYFALFAATIALWGFLEHESVGNSNAELALLLKRLWFPYLAMMPVAGLLFLYSLFYKKIPKQFWVFLIASAIIAVWSWFALLAWVSLFLFVLSMAEMIRVVIVAIRKKIPGAWIIGIGFTAFCLSLLTLILLILSGNFSLTIFYILIYITGILPVLLSMSVYLSSRVAGTHKNLDAEMKKTMELEVENARKEVELKKATELKEAYDALEKAHQTLKSTQTQLIQSEKMASLGELTAGIAHEIQNPLNFVNNFSEVNKELLIEMKDEISKGNLDEVKTIASDVIDNEDKIIFHGKRADAIVKGMLQHSRSSSGVKESTDINALCDEYLRLSYHGLRAKNKSFNATIKTDFDETIDNINIIPQDIGRVVLNLLTNAFYAVNEKKQQQIEGYDPTVFISTKKTGDKVLIAVKDNGNGISQKILDKIFQPFFTTKPTGQGTGLGLSLSYDIIKAHGGEIKVETKEGEGSDFIIQLRI